MKEKTFNNLLHVLNLFKPVLHNVYSHPASLHIALANFHVPLAKTFISVKWIVVQTELSDLWQSLLHSIFHPITFQALPLFSSGRWCWQRSRSHLIKGRTGQMQIKSMLFIYQVQMWVFILDIKTRSNIKVPR